MEILPQITQILAETPSIAIDTIRASFLKNKRRGRGNIKITYISICCKMQQVTQSKLFGQKSILTLGFKLTETPQTILLKGFASHFILNGSNRPLDI